MSLATRPLMFLKWATRPIAYAFAAFVLVRPFLSRSGFIRKFIFTAIGRTTNTLVYSKVQTEHFLVHSADNGIGKIVFATGEYDFQKFILAIDLCNKNLNGRKKPTILIDAGANIGTICIPAVARGFVQRAVAIEPEPLNCRLLRANIALNGLSNSIVVHECALGASTDIELALELNATNLGDHRIRVNTEGDLEQKNKVQVRSETLDGLCPPVDYSCSLLWMDIQGYEGFALLGGKELLKSRIPLIVEFWPYGMKRAGSFDAFKSAVAHYDGYFDLGNPDKMHSIDTLDNLYKAIGEVKEVSLGYTDILIL
jgi:FkbM family methyltransferase